jgi:hypothetical protein
MPLSVEEFTRGRGFTFARINELEEDGKGGRGVEVRNSTQSHAIVQRSLNPSSA